MKIDASEFESIFTRLRQIIEMRSEAPTVTADTPNHFRLNIAYSPKFNKGFPVAWVKVGKAYVSYHLMSVYVFPKLRDGLSKKLRARMQGESCFNFKIVDEALFSEPEQVTTRGFDSCSKGGVTQ